MTFRPMPEPFEQRLEEFRNQPHGAAVMVTGGPIAMEVAEYLTERAKRDDLILVSADEPLEPGVFWFNCERGFVVQLLRNQYGHEKTETG